MNSNKTTLILAGLLVLLAGLYFFKGNTDNTLDSEETAFAIKDTANIVELRIADYKDENLLTSVSLKRKNGRWYVNDKYLADPAKISTMLETFVLLQVREPVNEATRKTIFRYMKQRHTRVDVETGEGHKSYYLSHANPDDRSSYAMLDGAKSPYIVEIPGYTGNIIYYFSNRVEDWRSCLLFNVAPNTIASVKASYTASPNMNLELKNDKNNWLVNGSAADTMRVYPYLGQFGGPTNGQSFATEQYAEIYKQLKAKGGDKELEINTVGGEKIKLRLYNRTDNLNTYYGILDGQDELVVVQKQVVDRFFVPAQVFTGKP